MHCCKHHILPSKDYQGFTKASEKSLKQTLRDVLVVHKRFCHMHLLKNNNKTFFYDYEFSDVSPCEFYEEYWYSLVQFNKPEPVLGLCIIGRKMQLCVALH